MNNNKMINSNIREDFKMLIRTINCIAIEYN